MAKVTAPLFSFTARGKLADSIVFFPWKGIAAVRTYVIPSNPNSANQQTQRGYLSDAVAEWHAAGYSAGDNVAWNTFADLMKQAMSGFNRFCREFINEAILGNTWTSIHDCVISAVVTDGFTVNVTKVSGGDAPHLFYGTSKTALLTDEAMADQTGNDWEVALSGLAQDTMYYFTIKVGASGSDYGCLGVYAQRTAAS